jgi:hypothetical protein
VRKSALAHVRAHVQCGLRGDKARRRYS